MAKRRKHAETTPAHAHACVLSLPALHVSALETLPPFLRLTTSPRLACAPDETQELPIETIGQQSMRDTARPLDCLCATFSGQVAIFRILHFVTCVTHGALYSTGVVVVEFGVYTFRTFSCSSFIVEKFVCSYVYICVVHSSKLTL